MTDKKSMNKKKVILCFAVVFFVLVLIVLVLIKMSTEKKFDQYEKYSLSISIDLKDKFEFKSYLIDVSHDGMNARINSSNVNKDSYLIGEKIYYLEDETFYWYSVEKSYGNLYDLISNLGKVDFIKEINGAKKYSTLLSVEDVNEIIDSLFFKVDTNSKAKAEVLVQDDHVKEFNLVISDVEGYEEIGINIVVLELEKDYTVNVSRIYGNVGGGRRYKSVEAVDNVFEIADEVIR